MRGAVCLFPARREPGLAQDATYTLTLLNDARPAETESVTATVGGDGAFSADLPVPSHHPTGEATVLVAGSPPDECGGSESCAAYLVTVTVTEG